jgi:predicted metalloendopeptidase
VSGELTLGEDIADSGGVKMAHRAWQQAGGGKRSQTEEQLFFLSFAQTWCGVERKQAILVKSLKSLKSQLCEDRV